VVLLSVIFSDTDENHTMVDPVKLLFLHTSRDSTNA
jgi:hypothetical protein